MITVLLTRPTSVGLHVYDQRNVSFSIHVHYKCTCTCFFLHVKTNFREISGLFNVENVFVLKAQAELLCKEIAKLCT